MCVLLCEAALTGGDACGTRLWDVKKQSIFPWLEIILKNWGIFAFIFNVLYSSLRINKLKYRKILVMIQKRNHGLTEVSKNFCHWFNWGQGFTAGFTVMNSNLVLLAEQNIAAKKYIAKVPVFCCLHFLTSWKCYLLWSSVGLGEHGTWMSWHGFLYS